MTCGFLLPVISFRNGALYQHFLFQVKRKRSRERLVLKMFRFWSPFAAEVTKAMLTSSKTNVSTTTKR